MDFLLQVLSAARREVAMVCGLVMAKYNYAVRWNGVCRIEKLMPCSRDFHSALREG